MTGHRALEKKQITQGNNRKVQNPSGSLKKSAGMTIVMPADFLLFLYADILCLFPTDFFKQKDEARGCSLRTDEFKNLITPSLTFVMPSALHRSITFLSA